MKTFYENPDMEIVKFSIEDVIATSSEPELGSQEGGGLGGDNEGLPAPGGFPSI